MLTYFILASIICGSSAATTKSHHGQHSTHMHATHAPHHDIQNEVFHHDHTSETMVAKNGKNCYIYYVSPAEDQTLSTIAGLHAVEKTMIDLIDAGTFVSTMSHDDLMAMSKNLGHFCNAHTTITILNTKTNPILG